MEPAGDTYVIPNSYLLPLLMRQEQYERFDREGVVTIEVWRGDPNETTPQIREPFLECMMVVSDEGSLEYGSRQFSPEFRISVRDLYALADYVRSELEKQFAATKFVTRLD